VYDWLKDIPEATLNDVVEIRFKNTRKEFYINANGLKLKAGDIVAVEASPGHDIGVVSIYGPLVERQMKNAGNITKKEELKKIYRKAKQVDIDKWDKAIEREHETMLKSRQISENLKLNMKIGDVEYQGDGTKAIFYYIADDRVDFRELIKVLANEFHIRIEMKQIGARQEAGRIGGIGTCGRELCCATWLTNFVSVTTNAAKHQEVSLNPQKLAGQCGKLKCCLNYELPAYLDAQKDFPDILEPLQTEEGEAYHVKTDVYRRMMWFSFSETAIQNLTPVDVERVNEIIRINKSGKKVKKLTDAIAVNQNSELGFSNHVGEDSLTRFDDKKKKKKKKKRKKNKQFRDKKNT
jgi:cell fate regulator YaaT (PSP1 superfamily)